MKKYPECEKINKVEKEYKAIRDFMDWLTNEKGYDVSCTKGGAGQIAEHLALEFFDVDIPAREKEIQEMLEAL